MSTAGSDYKTLRESKVRKTLDERNDCSVIALAITTGESYGACWNALKDAGRPHQAGALITEMHAAAEALGYLLVDVTTSYPEVKSTRTATKLPKNRSFLFVSTDHVSPVKGGKVADWAGGRRFRTEKIFQVVGN